jgi:FAD/FMN-containing dehydrogenase
MRYPEMYPPEEGGYHPVAAGRNLFMDTVDQAAAELIIDRLRTSSAQMAVTQLRVLGGAMARVPADATAFAHRKRRIMANVAALYGPPQDRAVHEQWADDFAAVLGQGEPGAYVNFLSNEGEARVRAAYPGATWDRLVAVKRRYDPTNLFRLNHNIQPEAERPA